MVEDIKIIAKQTILNLRTLFAHKTNSIFFISFLLMAVSVSVIFIPFFAGAGVSIIVCILPISGIVYASINYNFRKSSLNKNANLTKNNRWLFYIATILTMLIMSSIMLEVLFVFFWICNVSNLLLSNWLQQVNFTPGEIAYKFSVQLNIIFLYSAILVTMMTFSISFMFQRFLSTQNSYFILIITLLTLSIIFGGGLNQYWFPNAWGLSRFPSQWILFPWDIYWISAIFPYFSMGSIANAGAYSSQVVIPEGVTNYFQIDLVSNNLTSYFNWEGQVRHTSMLGFFRLDGDPLWVLLLFTPYIQILIFFIVGLVISNIYRK